MPNIRRCESGTSSTPTTAASSPLAFPSPSSSSEFDHSAISGPWTPPATNNDGNITLPTLPFEIWDLIATWADTNTLASLARVNAVARTIAMRHLYNCISLPKMSDSTKLLETLCSPTSYEYSGHLRSLDIPINSTNSIAVNHVIKSLPQLSILKLKVTGHVHWPFKDTKLNLTQFHWEVLQEKGSPVTALEHGGGPHGLSNWLQTQPNIMKLKLVTHERICVPSTALRRLVRASGPMFIVSSLVPGRPVDTAQVTPRSRDATVGMSALGLSTGPLKHLKIVSRVDLDHHRLLCILSQSNSALETISFEICGQLDNMREFLEKALGNFPHFPELQSLSFCARSIAPLTTLDSNYYRHTTETVQRSCPKLCRVYFPGIMATLQPPRLRPSIQKA